MSLLFNSHIKYLFRILIYFEFDFAYQLFYSLYMNSIEWHILSLRNCSSGIALDRIERMSACSKNWDEIPSNFHI